MCGIIIESLLYDLINLTIEENVNDETVEGRLYKNLTVNNDKSTWSNFVNNIEIVFGIKLNDVVGNELWKDMSMLFLYRNYIVHGKPYREFKESKFIDSDKLDKLVEFFIERDIVSPDEPAKLNTKIADYFWNQSKEFCDKVSKELSDDYNSIVNQMFVESLN